MNNKHSVYDKIETVLRTAGRPLAPHEFEEININRFHSLSDGASVWNPNGLLFVGCSESALGRRLREMRELGRVYSATREGKAFKEFALVVKVVPEIATVEEQAVPA